MKDFKPQVLTFKSNTVMDGLDKVAKNILVHIKKNRKVYIQIGKVCIYATITATGLLMTDVICHASDFSAPAWAEAVDKKGLDLYWIADYIQSSCGCYYVRCSWRDQKGTLDRNCIWSRNMFDLFITMDFGHGTRDFCDVAKGEGIV